MIIDATVWPARIMAQVNKLAQVCSASDAMIAAQSLLAGSIHY